LIMPNHRNPTYHALIGDIVSSRTLPDRAGVQRDLFEVIERLNGSMGGALAAPLKLTAGDELQGLVSEAAAVVDIVVATADALHPAAVAWGMGSGSLTTDLVKDVALLDGPCFHRARSALKEARRDQAWLRQEGLPSPHGGVVTALFDLTWAVRSGWTATQLRYVRDAREMQQQEVAERYGVTKQAVSQSLGSAQFRAVRAGEGALRSLLRWVGEVRTEPGTGS